MESLNTQIGMTLWMILSLAIMLIWGVTLVKERSRK